MSDIVFLRCWVSVEIPKFYTPVINLLNVDKIWSGMRTVGELRRAKGESIPVNKVRNVVRIKNTNLWFFTITPFFAKLSFHPTSSQDSLYKEIERKAKLFKPLRVSKSLQKTLPFKTKPKVDNKRKKALYMTTRAVVSEPGEKRLTRLV